MLSSESVSSKGEVGPSNGGEARRHFKKSSSSASMVAGAETHRHRHGKSRLSRSATTNPSSNNSLGRSGEEDGPHTPPPLHPPNGGRSGQAHPRPKKMHSAEDSDGSNPSIAGNNSSPRSKKSSSKSGGSKASKPSSSSSSSQDSKQSSSSSSRSSASQQQQQPEKKEKIRNLWGKLGKAAEAGALSDKPRSENKKWDAVLNPLLLSSPSSSSKRSYATPHYSPVPSQASSRVSINQLNAPENSTIQCDCGNDSCPFCNLLLNMSLTDPQQLM